jgi:serine/threonine-protein kinase mTOR
LSELEEVIEYKTNSSKRVLIKQTWRDRLKGLQRNLEHWQTTLAIRSLVLSPEEQMEDWLKFSTLCRKSNKLQLSEKTLLSLGACKENTHPRVEYEYIRHVHDSGNIRKALEMLQNLSENVQTKDNSLLARIFLALGNWQHELDENNLKEENIPLILNNFKTATVYDKDWSKAWHSWAFMNSAIVQHYEKSNKDVVPYLCSAVNGYFKSISLSPDTRSSQQDILRLLTLWFQYGDSKKVEKALIDGFNTVSIDTWLQVIPQLIARIHSPSETIRRLIHDLLSKIGHVHPQALIYPLVVSTKSQSKMRKEAAETILGQLRIHSPTLVDQALLVSQELIRVAILWIELWHEGLEEASRLYFGEHDTKGMIKVLEPLHEMIEKAGTLSEIAFQQSFGRDLQEAWEWCQKYQKDKKDTNLTQAWDLYYHVFRRISKQLTQMLTLELQYVSPKLLDAKNLSLALPGTYTPGSDIIRIYGFSAQLKVLTSKQRPRKFKIFGSDGNEYSFLLKGHEDLRQDERVMQLFGLVNTLLKNDEDTSKRDLKITRYAVIPLSSNAGLIGWVENTDTLHSLIKEYRESRNILLNVEHRLMVQMAPEYDNLSLIQKIEVFEHALENTTGQDLYKVLWLKSRNSEIWLERRTNYTRSLAVMSMVGHILGLGDRHPSNLMLEKYTGKVVHIDFGDCFEVAMLRDKFPEKIPFRLTRMLVNAMEVSGIEGNFRSTCESVMKVLRQHKESVMAMLEAFVHDPLINWRLFVDEKVEPRKSSGVSITENALEGEIEKERRPSRSLKEKEYRKLNDEDTIAPTVLNQKAVSVIERISHKLNGRDFDINTSLNVPEQVNRLIESATSHSNLCQCYIGWCAFW